ncbi:hypothetical protein C8R43DRAFT_1118937 [Mycena crocata]|nr:hypothetical protein C8R43DRAFT_1118937 [Mycena crocata]
MSSITMPGIAVPGKLVVAQISKDLVVLMVGIIGHAEPLFCLADWSATKTEVNATARCITMQLVDCTPAGTLFRVDTDVVKSCQPAIHLRIGLDDYAAFWALAYLSVKSSSTVARPTIVSFSVDDQRHIASMLEFFKGDHGSEFRTGDSGVNTDDEHAPPGYTELSYAPTHHPREWWIFIQVMIDESSTLSG